MTRRDLIKCWWYAIPAMALGFAEPSEADQRRRRFGAARRSNSPRRLGFLAFSSQMINSVYPDLYAQRDPSPGMLDNLKKALLLPDNCRIDAVSLHCLFNNDQVALRVECDDFPEIQEACPIPQIDVWYTLGSDGLPQFDGWGDGAIRNVGPLHSRGS